MDQTINKSGLNEIGIKLSSELPKNSSVRSKSEKDYKFHPEIMLLHGKNLDRSTELNMPGCKGNKEQKFK